MTNTVVNTVVKGMFYGWWVGRVGEKRIVWELVQNWQEREAVTHLHTLSGAPPKFHHSFSSTAGIQGQNIEQI